MTEKKRFVLRQVTEYTIEYTTPNDTMCKTTPNILQLVENDLNRLCEDNTYYQKLFHSVADKVQDLMEENQQIKHTIKEAYETERTALGKSVLKQLINNME